MVMPTISWELESLEDHTNPRTTCFRSKWKLVHKLHCTVLIWWTQDPCQCGQIFLAHSCDNHMGRKKTPTQLNLDLPFQGHSRTPSNLVASSSPMLPLAMTVWPYNLLSLIKLSYCIWLLMRIYMWYPSQTGHSFRIFLSQDETLNHLLYYIHTPYGCEQASVSQTTMYMYVMLPVFSFSPSPPYPLPTNFPWCLCTKEVVSHFFIPNTIKCFSVVI